MTEERGERIRALLPEPLPPDFEPAFYDPDRHERRRAQYQERLIGKLYEHILRLEERIEALEAGTRKRR